MDQRSIQNAIERLAAAPRLAFGFYPTPVEEMPRLREVLRAEIGHCPRLFIKRDDYTGGGFGGNKVRKLEYVLARAVAEARKSRLRWAAKDRITPA